MVFLVNFVFFGLLVPFFKWVYSADYISNRLVLQIVVLFIGEFIWLLVYAHGLEKYCYKLNQKNSDLAGIIFCILHLIFAIVIRKKIVVINYWNFSLVICSIGFVVCCLYCLSLKNKENKALEEKKKKEIEDARKAEEERIEREKRLAEKNSEIEARKREEEENCRLFSSEKLRLVFQKRDTDASAGTQEEIVLILSNLYSVYSDDFSREFFIGSFDIVDENYAHDLELELKNKLAGFNLGSFISGCELEAFCYVVADEIVNKSRSEHIVKKNDKSWTIKAEELRKRKEREAEERRKREEEKYLADSVLDLYFSGNLSDESDGCVEIVLTTLNRDGEKIEINLGEYKRVKRKNGSKGFVASELKLDFKPRLLKILKGCFSDYIQESDRMDFCEVVIDELLTQGFSEQVFTRIADEMQGETSVDKSNDEDESSYYFGILGLRNDASLQDVEHSYKEMMKFWHPDQFAGNKKKQVEAEEHCKQLNVAYSWLKDYFQA